MKAQIELLAILHIVYSSLGILIAIASFLLLSGIGWFTGDATAMGVLGIIGALIAFFLGVVSIPGLVAGIGLARELVSARGADVANELPEVVAVIGELRSEPREERQRPRELRGARGLGRLARRPVPVPFLG